MFDPVRAFEEIRAIPYRIPLSVQDEDNCCSGKMKRFKMLLDRHGYVARYRVCRFKWSDMELPEKVVRVKHADDSTHVYLEVLIDARWIDVDPTWDTGLSQIFPIAQWDGKTSTTVAVKALWLFSEEESRRIMEESAEGEMEADLVENGEFYGAFNEYLEEVRTGEK